MVVSGRDRRSAGDLFYVLHSQSEFKTSPSQGSRCGRGHYAAASETLFMIVRGEPAVTWERSVGTGMRLRRSLGDG